MKTKLILKPNHCPVCDQDWETGREGLATPFKCPTCYSKETGVDEELLWHIDRHKAQVAQR